VAVFSGVTSRAENRTSTPPSSPLLAARQNFKTKLLPATSEGLFLPEKPPPAIYDLIHYPSPAGDLAAYISPDPQDHEQHPIVIWAHGGFGGIGNYFFTPQPDLNDQSPHAFRESGILVMIPSWRGENVNLGRREMFFGEVDDALAAIKYARSLPYVDKGRIYFAGHSTGGTMALLTAEASAQIRATFSFGPTADLRDVGWEMPFNRNDSEELRVRSAINFVGGIVSPTFCIEGSRSSNCENFPALQNAADREKVPLHALVVSHGTHFNILHPLTQLLSKKILADSGATCNITLTKVELDKEFTDFMEKTAKDRTTPLVAATPQAADFINTKISSAGIPANNFFFRFDLDVNDRTTTRFAKAVLPGDIQVESHGIHLLLSPAANLYLDPFVLDFDQVRQHLTLQPRLDH
jgi:alpha/beta superfamily hydrolase